MIDGLWTAALILFCVCGVVITVFRLPGTWLVVAAAAGYSWHFDWSRPGWQVLVGLVAAAVVGEVLELLMSVVAARKAGAGRRASWCALIGGFVGMFVFTLPLPVLGTILGGLLGCFLGAMIGELSTRRDIAHGARVGLFATVGQILGSVAKTMIAVVMAGTAVVTAVW